MSTMNKELRYAAQCHATRIRALGAWLRASLPVVFWNAPVDDYEFGCDLDHWAEAANCVIMRTTQAADHGHYKLATCDGNFHYTVLSEFRWQFTPP
jgi:hypothetical protein